MRQEKSWTLGRTIKRTDGAGAGRVCMKSQEGWSLSWILKREVEFKWRRMFQTGNGVCKGWKGRQGVKGWERWGVVWRLERMPLSWDQVTDHRSLSRASLGEGCVRSLASLVRSARMQVPDFPVDSRNSKFTALRSSSCLIPLTKKQLTSCHAGSCLSEMR